MKTKSKQKKNITTNSTIDNLVIRCIIEEMGRNPISFIPIINEILSTNNPDNRVIIENISKGLTKAAISQKDLVNSVYNKIIELVDGITTDEVVKIVNEQRMSLSADSKKFLEEVARTTMVNLCEKYFESKRKQIDDIIKDYFNSIITYTKQELEKTSKKCKKEVKEAVTKNQISLDIPANMKDDVVQYVQFLQSKK